MRLFLRALSRKFKASISLSRPSAEASASAGTAEAGDEEAPSMTIAAAVGFFGVSWRRSSWLAASNAP